MRWLPYDYLVLTTCSENDYFGNPVLAAHTRGPEGTAAAHPCARLPGASRLVWGGAPERCRWLTFVVVSAGPTGVESTGAWVELLKLVLGREYRELPPEVARVTLVEGTASVLLASSARLAATSAARLSAAAWRCPHRGTDRRDGE